MSKEVFATYLDDVARVQEFYGAFASRLDNVPSDGGWSASQCLAHICDAEISLSLRVRMILTSDNYQFSAWDEDAFAAIKKIEMQKQALSLLQPFVEIILTFLLVFQPIN
jgi:hypothetical protein